jgi:hypothetical protein
MRSVLIVYQDVELQNAKRAGSETASRIITVSVDDKLGVQVSANSARPAAGTVTIAYILMNENADPNRTTVPVVRLSSGSPAENPTE